ncbi:MAG: leucyl aminopeptidase [Acidobacteria bacterium]|nr:leucyl aminopeptidase [Acidobacteriota bacterium]
MKIEFETRPLEQVEINTLVAYGFENAPGASGTVELLHDDIRGVIAELNADRELNGKNYECTLIHRPVGLAAQKLLLVGAGKKNKFDEHHLRRLAGAGARHLRARGIREFAWIVDGAALEGYGIQAITEGLIIADYDADRYRTERNDEKRIERVVLATNGAMPGLAAEFGLNAGRIIAEAQNFTRDLVNEPSNTMTPGILARKAEEMAGEYGLECQILGTDEIKEMKMGAFWGVAQGSSEPPRLIVLRYVHPEAAETPVIGIIGKGITFDSGGISIKPAENMHEMKTDMAGGAAMLGVMRALAQVKPRAHVIAVIPATENMPGGRSYKPGDVLTSMSGKTIEVLNTDAEGRLVLADALTYAKQLGCDVLIDAATLTGAVMIALGNICTGVFGWNQEWVNRILASADSTGERMWQLPIDDDYREQYKSLVADIANTGGRYGGAITAAMFIGEFAGDTPWVHLDIAGTRWTNEEKPYLAKGPTGVGVRTLVHLLTHLE